MSISYKKLWKLMIDKEMSKTDLRIASGISTNALAKLGKNEAVSIDVLEKICLVLACDISDIVECPVKENTHSKKIQDIS